MTSLMFLSHFNPLMPGGNKKVIHTSAKLQVCLSICDLFVPPDIKGLMSGLRQSKTERIIKKINRSHSIAI